MCVAIKSPVEWLPLFQAKRRHRIYVVLERHITVVAPDAPADPGDLVGGVGDVGDDVLMHLGGIPAIVSNQNGRRSSRGHDFAAVPIHEAGAVAAAVPAPLGPAGVQRGKHAGPADCIGQRAPCTLAAAAAVTLCGGKLREVGRCPGHDHVQDALGVEVRLARGCARTGEAHPVGFTEGRAGRAVPGLDDGEARRRVALHVEAHLREGVPGQRVGVAAAGWQGAQVAVASIRLQRTRPVQIENG